jgi:dephospho-CoA kinase
VIRVGLTGGIASGKTTVADLFAELGAVLIDTDIIARDVVRPGTPALGEIADTFGEDVMAPGGALDRRALRELVFDDAGKRRALEAIVHPRIRAEAERQMRTLGGPYQIIIVPLLVGSPLQQELDRILVVDCSEETQLQRLCQRDGVSEQLARKMVASQASRDERLAIADDVVSNDGELHETRRQVEQLHRHYLELAAAVG